MLRLFLSVLTLVLLTSLAAGVYWVNQPLHWQGGAKEVTIPPGVHARQAAKIIAQQGIPLSQTGFIWYARFMGQAEKIKAGTYRIENGSTLPILFEHLIRGDFVESVFTIVEGWNFLQLKQALQDLAIRGIIENDIQGLKDSEMLRKIGASENYPEGLFCPETYHFPKGTKATFLLHQAYKLQKQRLTLAWEKRNPDLPLNSSYEALILASIIEKETGRPEDRQQIAAVFINRLQKGMLLQTDPTVIYGLGKKFDGNLHKRDLQTDTPYNTYTRVGLPPTPIALPGKAAIQATLNPAQTDALYFVSRGDGTSHFSTTLNEHNRAVDQYQRKRH